jgi:hypothetical protein
MKSSQNKSHQILGVISVRDAESFLQDWANMVGPWPLADMGKESALRLRDSSERIRRRYKNIIGDSRIIGHLWLRDFLRRAWDSSDLRERDWYLFKFRDLYNLMVRRSAMSEEERKRDEAEEVRATAPRHAPPDITPIEAAIVHLQRNAHRARRCLNPECPAPFFFARVKGQRYCCEACVLPAQRAAKLRWWNKNRAKYKKRRK